MKSPLLRFGVIALRIGVAAACCVGIGSSWRLLKADRLFHHDTNESIRAALYLEPDDSEYSMRLAQIDEEHAQKILESAVRLDPYNAQADIELGLDFEVAGDYVRAEKFLQSAFAVDHTFLPRWSLANFYFRRGDMTAFWIWAKRAAEMPSDNVAPLFELCWRVSPDPDKISSLIVGNDPNLIRQYLSFLLSKDELRAAASLAPRLMRAEEPNSDRALLFDFVNRLVAAGDPIGAKDLWSQLIQSGWVVADSTAPNNADFRREPLPVTFDWSLPEYKGLHSWPGPAGLQVEFTGEQPEDCLIAEQTLALAPGVYSFSYSYRTEDIEPGTGIHWQILDATTNTMLATSNDLSNISQTESAIKFSVLPNTPLVRLQLMYQRSLGTPRISGSLMVQSTGIQRSPS